MEVDGWVEDVMPDEITEKFERILDTTPYPLEYSMAMASLCPPMMTVIALLLDCEADQIDSN